MKKEKPRFRILEVAGKFYPQQRGLFCWWYFEESPDSGEVRVWRDTLEKARQYIKFHLQAAQEIEEISHPKRVIHSFE